MFRMIENRWRALLVLPWSFCVLAASPTSVTSTSQPTTEESFPSLKTWAATRQAPLDKELAGQLIERQDATPDKLAELNFQIDVRIIERWFLQQTAAAKPQSQTQIIALLRSLEIADLRAALPAADASAAISSRPRTEAMDRLHRLTFKLGETKDVAELDDVAKRVGVELLAIAVPNAPRPESLPMMRPPVLATTQPSTRKAIRSLSDLSAAIPQTAISVSLRKQLMAVARAASDANKDKPNEALELREALGDGVELARGLSNTTAFSSEARDQIEQQLAEGLALVSDPRTRLAGRERIHQLDEYRSVMDRLATSNLGPEVRTSLNPALTYAQTHADQGEVVLNLVQDYLQITQQFETDSHVDTPVPNLRNTLEQVSHQFSAARQTFLNTANQLGSGSTVQTLQTQLADLRELGNLYNMLAQMPHTFQTLNSYHPRPYGGIESHVLRAASAASSNTHTSLRAEGIAYLTELTRLARLSNSVTQNSLADISPEVLQNYAGVSVAEFTSKCTLLIGDLVNQLATGRETDRRAIARLNAVEVMIDGLRHAQFIEQELQSAATLQRWADWTLTPEQLHGLMAPYRTLLSGAFAGFVKDDAAAVEEFVLGRRRLQPILEFLNRDGFYSEYCGRLPEGLPGDVARLMTPMTKEPFELERFVSYAMSVSAALDSTDPSASDAAKQAAIDRISQEFEPDASK
jgi:hypothetical protein